MAEKKPLLNGAGKQETAWNSIVDQVNKLNNDVAQVERLTTQIGGPRDSDKLRTDLRLIREDCAAHAKSVINSLNKYPYKKEDKVKYERLLSQANEISKRAQKSIGDSINKERTVLSPPRTVEQPTVTTEVSTKQEEDPHLIIQIQKSNLSIEEEIIKERESQMKFLENELIGLNEVFKDVAALIHEDQEKLDLIEENTITAVSNVEEGRKQLTEASELQKKSRSKMCCLLLIILIIVAILTIFFGVFFGVIKKN